MKRILFIWAFALLSLPLSAQFGGIDVEGMVHNPNQYIGQQQKEIGSVIESEVKAQIRQQQTKTNQSLTPAMRSQTQTTQTQTQTAQQQALQDFNTRISAEGQHRMEHYNNPDNYINRSITNRKSSLNANSANSTSRYNSQNQPNDMRTRPVHSEELTSKSLQMLHEANREYFSNEDRETTIDPNAQVPLFDAPSLGVPLWQELEEKMDMEEVYAELTPEQKSLYDKKKKEILDKQELAELQDQIADYNNFFNDSGFDGARSAVILNSSKKYEAQKEIAKAKEELQELEKWARKTVRNNRNK